MDDYTGTVQFPLWWVAMTALKKTSQAKAMTNPSMVTGTED